MRWGVFCEGVFEGKYDADDDRCVDCDENHKQIKAVKCGAADDYTVECEYVCGADEECDEKNVGDTCGWDYSNFCCVYEIDTSSTDCVPKGKVWKGKWLCDPGRWVECNGLTLEKVITVDNSTYTCSKEGNNHIWVKGLESEVMSPLVSIIQALIDFFKGILQIR